jgi:hypothetical protein
VLSQVGVDVRVLVIDDCSNDASTEVARAIAATEPRLEVRRHSVNQGHIATYNEGLLDWADADYTVLLSADDLLAPGALARAAHLMASDSAIGMVYGRAPYFRDHTALPKAPSTQRGSTRWSGEQWIEDRCRAGHNVISSPEVVIRTEIQQKVGGYRPELPHAGDLEMWLRIAAVSDVAYIRGVPQAYYRVHDESMQRQLYSGALDDLEQRRRVFEMFFEGDGALLDDAPRLHALAQRALAREALWRVCRAYDRDQLDTAPVDELIEFAESTYPHARTVPEYRALQRRQWLGPQFCHRTQLFAASAASRRLRSRWRFERWKRRGS